MLMDKKAEDTKKSPKIKPLVVDELENDEMDGGNERDNDEKAALLPPRKGGLSKKTIKTTKRSVQWNDRDGDKLAEVLEFQPSDVSESEDDDSDSCLCVIM